MFRNNFTRNQPLRNNFPPSHFRNRQQPFQQSPSQQIKSSLPEKINSGVGGISKVLTNVQQVLKVVDSASPIVKEYGPMIKNIPNMYRLLKAFKSIEKEEEKLPEQKQINHEENILTENMVKSIAESNKHPNPRLYI